MNNSAYDLYVEFFKSDGNSQGELPIGTDTYTVADAGQSKTITIPIVPGAISGGDRITATVTDALGNTSEFALQFTVANA